MPLKSCCCGCSLSRGSLFIGWVSLIFQMVSLLLFIGGLVLYLDDDVPYASTTQNLDSEFHTTSPLWISLNEKGELPKELNEDSILKPEIKIELIPLIDSDDASEEISEGSSEEADFIIFRNVDEIFRSHMLSSINLLLNNMHEGIFDDGLDINSRKRREVDSTDMSKVVNEGPELIAGIVGSALQIITSILLIVGVKTERLNFLLPWICTTFLVIVLETVHVIYCLLNITDHEVDTLLDIVFIGIYMYMLTIVFSHYKELKELKKKENSDIYKDHPECPWASSDISILPISEKKMEKI